jgi:nucleoside-diphosphate-sugar epimerase
VKRYAVIGASSGVGLEIVKHLTSRGDFVRAIARHPQDAETLIEPWAADVTDAAAMVRALAGDFDAVFFTVDIHGKSLQRDQVRRVMVEGSANAVAAAKLAGVKRFVLLSVIGADKRSWVWWLLNAMKPGMRDNVLARELALAASGIEFVICRAARLVDGADGRTTVVTEPRHRMNMRRSIKRANLALALVNAAERAPANSVWDVFSGPGGETAPWPPAPI